MAETLLFVEQIDGFNVISADEKHTNDVNAGFGIIVGCRRIVESGIRRRDMYLVLLGG